MGLLEQVKAMQVQVLRNQLTQFKMELGMMERSGLYTDQEKDGHTLRIKQTESLLEAVDPAPPYGIAG